MKRFISVPLLAAVASLTLVSGLGAQTLSAIKSRGVLACGVSQGLGGFSFPNEKGQWSGFDVDFCRAVAAAALGDAEKVQFVPLSASERFEALKSGAVDLLARNTTWTMGRETELGLIFAGITYFDGQGFLVSKARGLTSALELSGAKVCVQSATTTETNLVEYFAANGMTVEIVRTGSPADSRSVYDSGRCDVITSDMSQLYAERLSLKEPGAHTILPDVISKEPLGPVVRAGDVGWFNIVKWVHFALINAEELGITQSSVGDALRSAKPDVKRLVGTEGTLGSSLGLTPDWAAQAVRAVGNYGEVFERNVGSKSPLGIPRGLNQLWTMGGILYAPPLR